MKKADFSAQNIVIRGLLTISFLVFIYLSTSTGTTVTINPIADSYGRGGDYSGDNYGSENTFLVKQCSDKKFSRKAILKFDLSSFNTVDTATLRIKTYEKVGDVTLKCYFVSADSWTEEGVTWDNMPSTNELLTDAAAADEGGWTEFLITSKVIEELNSDGILSVIISRDNCSNFQAYSKEDLLADNLPELEIITSDLTHNITASSRSGGTVSPSGTTEVTEGGSQKYVIFPDTENGYRIEDVLVDGVSQGAVSSYEFTNVTEDHTISARFIPTDTLTPIDDSYVRGGDYDNNNYGDEPILEIKTSGGSLDWSRETILKFNLSSLTQIGSAKLRLKVSQNDGQDVNCYFTSDDSWTEDGIKWSNLPSKDELLTDTAAASAEEWTEFDITSKVMEEINGNDTISLILVGKSTPILKFYSKENLDIAIWPQLVVTSTGLDTVAPGPPDNLVAAPGPDSVALDWDDNIETDLAGYNIYRSETSGSGHGKINTSILTSSFYTDNNVSNGTTYYYTITAVDDSTNESEYSAEIATTPTLEDTISPQHPVNLLALAYDDSVSLNWDDNNDLDLAGYNIYRSTTSGSGYNKVNDSLINKSEFNDTGVSNGITYFYVVTAVDDSTNESGYSGEVNATPQNEPDGLPTPWQNTDVGNPKEGSALYSNGVFTLEANGDDIFNENDNFHYVYKSFSGNGSILAKVESLENTHEWAKAGVMIRETLGSNSTHASMVVTGANGTSFQRRPSTGGSGQSTHAKDGLSAPVWVKIERIGDTFSGYTSTNGTTWAEVGTVEIAMKKEVYIGIAATSHEDGILGTSEFSNVTISSDSLPPASPSELLAMAFNNAVTLNWNKNYEGDLTGYNIYRSTTSGSGYTKLNDALIDTSGYSDTTVINETLYYYVVTAVDVDNNESGHSNEVSVTPSANIRIIKASAMNGGSISPSGTKTIAAGNNLTFDFIADEGYRVKEVFVDDSLVDATDSYTFTNISDDHTIVVTFEPYNISSKVYYATPDGAGIQDGSSWENAITGAEIESFINSTMKPGDKLLLDNNGGYFSEVQLNIKVGGLNNDNRITIEGLNRGGGYPLFKGPGRDIDNFIDIDNAVSFVTIKNLKIEDYKYAVRTKEGINNPNEYIIIDGLDINNVTDGLYLHDFRNSTIKNCEVTYHTKRGIRLKTGCRNIEIINCLTDHNMGNYGNFPSDQFAVGFEVGEGRHDTDPLDQTNITFVRCEARNCVDDDQSYWNGDGFLVNDKHQNIKFISCIAFGNADGGWDNKGIGTYFENCIAINNGRNFRTWHSGTYVNCLAVNPTKYADGASGGHDNFWLDGQWGDAIVDLYNCTSHNGSISSSGNNVKINSAENCIFSQSSGESKIASGSNNVYTDDGDDPNYKSPSDDYQGIPLDAYNSLKYGPGQGYWYSEGNAPEINQINASPDKGESPLNVQFSAIVTDPDGNDNAITYEWDFDDGATSQKSQPLHTYKAPGTYIVVLKVTDDSFITSADSISVEVTGNYPPTISFIKPANQQVYFVGSPVNIEVDANDPDGSIDSVIFYYNNIQLATDTEAPYEYAIQGLAEGNYIIEAIAYDNELASSSSLINITSTMPIYLSEISWDNHVELYWIDNITNYLAGFGEVSGYNIYRSSSSGSGYIKINSSLLDTTVYVDYEVSGDALNYYYVVTAVDNNGIESNYSNEVSALPQPSFKLGCTEDAHVRDGQYGDENYGKEDVLMVKTSVEDWQRFSYIKFDLSSLDSPTKALLRVKVTDVEAMGHSVKCYLSENDSWTEEEITWNTKPDTSALIDIAMVPGSQSWIEFDLTEEINEEISGDGKITIVLVKVEFGNPGYFFHSKEAAESSNRPILSVVSDNMIIHNISASASEGGSIDPAGDIPVIEGYSQSFTITPNSGFIIEDVLVDNTSQGAINSYTFSDINANHSISATFTQIPAFTITASAGEGGSISPVGEIVVNEGDNQNFNITPDNGYAISDVLVDGSSVGVVSEYEFADVSGDHSIKASFQIINSISVVQSKGGFQLYPNPAKDKFTVSSSGHLFRLEVYSMNGCLIKTCKNLNDEKVIHSNELNGPGVYMLKIFTNDKLEIKKLIIQ